MNELPTPRTAPRRRIMLAGLSATVLAGGVAAAVLVSGQGGGTVPPAQPQIEPAIKLVGAPFVLTKASETAAAQPDLNPAKGQYLYFEVRDRQSAVQDGNGNGAAADSGHHRTWLAAYGNAPGWSADGDGGSWLCDTKNPNGEPAVKGDAPADQLSKPPTGCKNDPAYKTGLPTDAAAMKDWIYKHSQGGNPPDVQAFHTVTDVTNNAYITPKSLSALFKAAADIPGTKVIENIKDAAGRPAVAVGQSFAGVSMQLIFDPKTYRFLGERQVVDYDDSFRPEGGDEPGLWKVNAEFRKRTKLGQVLYASSVVRVAVTDKPGMMP